MVLVFCVWVKVDNKENMRKKHRFTWIPWRINAQVFIIKSPGQPETGQATLTLANNVKNKKGLLLFIYFFLNTLIDLLDKMNSD